MPKVLRIINRLNIGGPTYNVAYLTKYMAPKYETLLVSGVIDDGEESSEYVVDQLGIKPHYIHNMKREISPLKDRKAYLELKELIKKYKPDIVHTHAAKAGAVGRLAAAACEVPVILHTFHGHVFHSYFGKIKTQLYISIEKYLAKKCSKIIAISDIQKQELSSQFKITKEDNIAVIPNGFDLDRFETDKESKRKDFRTRYQIEDDEVAVGIIGRMVHIKNHPMFVRMIKETQKLTNKKFKAIIIGDGEDRLKIENLCRELELPFAAADKNEPSNLVTFTSWIKNIDWAVAGLDIIALTSFNEGTPVCLVEAQAASRPVLSTLVGGVADTMQDEISGFISPSEDALHMAQKLAQLIDNESLRLKMGNAGRAFAFKQFSYQRLVNDMSNLYDGLLDAKRAKR